MVGSFLAPKWPILVPFCGMDHQKSNFSLISDTLSVRGCWGQPMLFFWKLIHETQMSNTCHHADRDILSKFSILLPLRAVYFRSYLYETPCSSSFIVVSFLDSMMQFCACFSSKVDWSNLVQQSTQVLKAYCPYCIHCILI